MNDQQRWFQTGLMIIFMPVICCCLLYSLVCPSSQSGYNCWLDFFTIEVYVSQQTIKIHRWLYPDAILMAVLSLVGLGVGWQASVIILDDAMITFRVAENLAFGRGFVYNVGERVQVTTAPLYAMGMAAGALLFGSAPRAALVFNIALAALIPALAYDVGRRLAGRVTGVGAALLLVLMPLLVNAFSMESYLYVALILASMDAYLSGRLGLAGILVGLTALVRGDGVLLGAAMLSYDALVWRRLRLRLIVPAMLIPASWYLFATLYYGSPFPATLAAKTAQGDFNWLGERFLSGFGEYWEDWVQLYSRLFYLFPVLVGVGVIRAVWTDRRWLVLIARDALYIGVFVGLGVTFAEWYYAPLMPGVALLTARGVQFVANLAVDLIFRRVTFISVRLTRMNSGLLSIVIAAVLITVLLATIYPVTADIIRANPNWKAQIYPQAGRWLAKNTNTSANLATIDIGHLGYWSGRQIIDIVGLAQPDVAPHIAQGDFGYAIRQYQPDMILVGSSWLPEVQSQDWFQDGYALRHVLRIGELDEPLILFTRYQGVKVQEPIIPPIAIQPINIDFNRQVTLTGYYVNMPAAPGARLNLTLFWRVQAPIEVDFTVFVQLIDAENNILAQGDAKPQQGFYPTPYWQPGEQIIDNYTLPLAPDLPPGTYEIVLGFYEAENGTRLQILDEAGQFAGDHARLTGIEVQSLQ